LDVDGGGVGSEDPSAPAKCCGGAFRSHRSEYVAEMRLPPEFKASKEREALDGLNATERLIIRLRWAVDENLAVKRMDTVPDTPIPSGGWIALFERSEFGDEDDPFDEDGANLELPLLWLRSEDDALALATPLFNWFGRGDLLGWMKASHSMTFHPRSDQEAYVMALNLILGRRASYRTCLVCGRQCLPDEGRTSDLGFLLADDWTPQAADEFRPGAWQSYTGFACDECCWPWLELSSGG
jgi:hypothetical protein